MGGMITSCGADRRAAPGSPAVCPGGSGHGRGSSSSSTSSSTSTSISTPNAHRRTPKASPGFTLIELIVVVAITSILLLLLLGPIGQALNLTSRGQALV